MPQSNKTVIFGVDGGATSSKAVALTSDGQVLWRGRAEACNATLLSLDKIAAVFKKLKADFDAETSDLKVVAVSACLAGMIDEKTRSKVELAVRRSFKSIPIFVSHDLMSGLYGGLGHGTGVVVISGTGSSVFAKSGQNSMRVGGWGHVLGDAGSGYHIAHLGLRSVVASFDLTGQVCPLGAIMLRMAQVHTLEQLTTFVSVAEKKSIAELSNAVFEAASHGHKPSKEIIEQTARCLAQNVLAVFRRLQVKNLPITVTGGVFGNQPHYLRVFRACVKKVLPKSKVYIPKYDGATGACLWGWEQMSLKPGAQNIVVQSKATDSLVDLSKISTEEVNPRSKNLSRLPVVNAVELMLREDERIIPAIREEKKEIAAAVLSIARAFKKGGRLFYVGAGTSGRLGVLDASECPPTFSVPTDMVQGIMAGGFEALHSAVEGAEDDYGAGQNSVEFRRVNKNDVVCGIAASGRTPFVLGALDRAKQKEARTILLTCNPKIRDSISIKIDHQIHLATGPETLTGSTRLRAGTATKMVLNMFSTLSLVQIGKVLDNYMIDVNATNEKLRARATRLVMTLGHCDSITAKSALEKSAWQVRLALKKIPKKKVR